jgi:hypothetical protein
MNAQRLVPLSGIPAVVLILAGAGAAGNTPRENASVTKLVSFYTKHDTGQVTSGVLVGLGGLFFLIFAATVVSALNRRGEEARVSPLVCFGGALVFVGGLSLAAGISVFIGEAVDDLDPAALQALHIASLTVVYPWTIGASGFLLGAGVGSLQTRTLAPWLGWSAIVLGVLAAIPNHVLGGVLDHIGVVPIVGLGIWAIVVSVMLSRRAEAAL